MAFLSANEIEEIRKAYHLLGAHVASHAGEFMVRWFKADPRAMVYFTRFKGASVDEVKTHSRFRLQAAYIFNMVNLIVRNLHDTAVLIDILSDLDRDHRPRTGTLTKQQYDIFVAEFMKFCQEQLGANATPGGIQGLTKVLNYIGEGAKLYH